MSERMTRRTFLGTSGRTAAGIAAGLSAGPLVGRARAVGANDRILVGMIGCGGMANQNRQDFMLCPEVEIIACCDVDENQFARPVGYIEKQYKRKPHLFKDYRKLLDMKEIDAVIVATPDHWHAAPTMAACAAGKDVYVEKPCSHNVREARAMVDAARKYKRVVQVGTQQRSGPHFQEAVKYIQDGKLGQVTMTRTWTYGNETPAGLGNDPDSDPPPGVDYDMWLGPAPKRPFNRRRFHASFRWYFDYAAGMVGDWNVHLQDIVQWAMQTPHPVSVTAVGGKYAIQDDRDTPDTMQVVYEFPTYVHTYTLRKCSGAPWWAGGYGMEFSGTNGTLYLSRNRFTITPDPVQERMRKPEDKWRCEAIDREKGSYGDDVYWEQHVPHVRNFIDCMKSREKPICDIEVHFPTMTSCHLANVSLRVGRRIFWDSEKELCFRDRERKTPDEEANRLLGREYRKGYELPQV